MTIRSRRIRCRDERDIQKHQDEKCEDSKLRHTLKCEVYEVIQEGKCPDQKESRDDGIDDDRSSSLCATFIPSTRDHVICSEDHEENRRRSREEQCQGNNLSENPRDTSRPGQISDREDTYPRLEKCDGNQPE